MAHELWNAVTARTTMSRNFGIHTFLSARDARQHNTRAAAPTRFLAARSAACLREARIGTPFAHLPCDRPRRRERPRWHYRFPATKAAR